MSSNTTYNGKNLDDLRAVLFATIEAVRSGHMDITKASTINDLSRTLVDTAKVEVDFLRVTDGVQSGFLQAPSLVKLPAAEASAGESSAGNGIVSIVRHTCR